MTDRKKTVRKKFNEETQKALLLFASTISDLSAVNAEEAKSLFWSTLESKGYKPGQHMQMLRVSLTGDASGPDLMTMIEILGPEEVSNRIKNSLDLLSKENQNG